MNILIAITGIITCLPIVYTLFPKFALSKLNNTVYNSETGFFIKHWGVLCLMMGVAIIYASLHPIYLPVILTMAVFEKLLLVLIIFWGYKTHKNKFYKSLFSTMAFDIVCSLFYLYLLLF